MTDQSQTDDENEHQRWQAVQDASPQDQSSSGSVRRSPQMLSLMSANTGLAQLAAPVTRPGSGTGAPDIVKFGIFAKTFYGASLKNNMFKIDCVMNLIWTDARVTALVPAGQDSLTLSGSEAEKQIWMPAIVITNRDIRKYEVISTSVIIKATGEVQKIERAVVNCMDRFLLDEYPFDEQDLTIRIASEKYLSDSVELQPDDDGSATGYNDDLFMGQPYKLNGHKIKAFEEIDGALKKSRGVFDILAVRKDEKYWENHLVPAMTLTMISWGVFWFPFKQPFITPRLALSILSLLTFTTLCIKSSGELPDGAPSNWNDLMNGNIRFLMFMTIILNIFCEVSRHTLNLENVAVVINSECQFLIPATGTIMYIIVLTAGEFGWLSLTAATIVSKSLIGLVMLIYIGCSSSSLFIAHAEKMAEEAEKQAAQDEEQLHKELPK
jgi:hypothetical protein